MEHYRKISDRNDELQERRMDNEKETRLRKQNSYPGDKFHEEKDLEFYQRYSHKISRDVDTGNKFYTNKKRRIIHSYYSEFIYV